MKIFVSYWISINGKHNLKEYRADQEFTAALERVATPDEHRYDYRGVRLIFEVERWRWRKVPNRTEVREFLDELLASRS